MDGHYEHCQECSNYYNQALKECPACSNPTPNYTEPEPKR